jgi:hypothetical protein
LKLPGDEWNGIESFDHLIGGGEQWHCRICGDRRILYSEMVRKHIANEHNETMPSSMYEYFHGAVWHSETPNFFSMSAIILMARRQTNQERGLPLFPGLILAFGVLLALARRRRQIA